MHYLHARLMTAQVYRYMARVMHGLAAVQDGEALRRAVPSSSLFVAPNLSGCLRPELEASGTLESWECTHRVVRAAAAAQHRRLRERAAKDGARSVVLTDAWQRAAFAPEIRLGLLNGR